jgi:N-sulfoglucosamine sulfohydrolase|tara:strand:+ start:429 stop:1820 length:1392 start_codon:yes stop_codon:yes gene_type:complete
MRHLLFFLLLTASHAAERPNLLFINVDDMNRDSAGTYGCPIKDITPNIDKLASEGIAFDRGFVTVAICQPTRAVWMTGRYPHRSGALGFNHIKPDVASLPEALKKGGYYNALIGKALHIIPTRHKAFDYIRDQRKLGQGRDPAAYADATRTAIEAAKKEGKPFFIMASAHDPHRPFADSQGDFKKLPPVTRTITPEEVVVPGFLPDLPDIRKELAQYFTSVHRGDQVVGAILAEIDKAGLRDNTMVVFMSDHGMPLPFAKTNCYIASTIIPWIVRWPGHTKPGSRDAKHFVSGIDLAPTLLAAAGLANLPGADGSSFLPILDGKEQPERNKVFTSINTIWADKPYHMRAVNDGDFLYIWNGWADGKYAFKNESMSGLSFKAMRKAAETDPAIAKRVELLVHRVTEEMYDIRTDPSCLHNLIAKPNDAFTPRSSAMSKALWHQMKRTKDPLLKKFQQQVELALD